MTRVIVSVADSHLSGIDRVAEALRAAGLEQPKVLRAAGVVVGEFGGSSFDALAAIEGVETVEQQRLIGI